VVGCQEGGGYDLTYIYGILRLALIRTNRRIPLLRDSVCILCRGMSNMEVLAYFVDLEIGGFLLNPWSTVSNSPGPEH
jgi:hypothetical protein